MPGETKDGMTPDQSGLSRGSGGPRIECTEFESWLSDAMDGDDGGAGGQLSPARQQSFDAHRRVCQICGPMFAEVQAGRQWLRTLQEVEPPVYLVHNILAATSGVLSTRTRTLSATGAATRDGRTTPFGERMRERWDSFFAPVSAFVRQPRFVMSFGMIFFSFSLALNAAGVKASDVSKVDLRPSAVRHAYIEAQVKVVKYYDNIRFVYEIESKLRELKRANTPSEQAPSGQQEQKENRKNNNTSGQPDQKQDRNYSKDYDQPVLAALQDAQPAATAATNRRFV
jgi:hypothetical protein